MRLNISLTIEYNSLVGFESNDEFIISLSVCPECVNISDSERFPDVQLRDYKIKLIECPNSEFT